MIALILALALPAHAKTIQLSSPPAAALAVSRTESVRGDAKVLNVQFQLRKLKVKANGAYVNLAMDSLPLTSDVGLPALPFQAVTVDAAPGDIRVAAFLGEPVRVSVGRVRPAQAQACRCATPQPKAAFADKLDSYVAPSSGFRIESLGDFRGQPVSRALLFPHKYDPKTGELLVYPNARFEVSYTQVARAKVASAYDFLVITPRDLAPGLAAWMDWKRTSADMHFNVVNYEDIGSPAADKLKAWIHAEYQRANFKYALLIGARSRIPQLIVKTTTDPNTPSDLPYFTMGGDADVIPDVLAGRVVANDAATLARITKKWVDYERDGSAASGWHRDIGVASNQKGQGPSDVEYVQSVEDKLKSAFGADGVSLFQANSDSTPANFNEQMNQGAMWVTYVGHGSGIDWPSFGTAYELSDIANLRNASAVKPVWIDVACLNGTLEPGAAGATLASAADPTGAATGVTAYLGGTVLVSWDPPAIFARGVAYKMADMVRPVLGEAIQAGQRYLTENTSNVDDIASNQRWYHLQGDPSLRLRLK